MAELGQRPEEFESTEIWFRCFCHPNRLEEKVDLLGEGSRGDSVGDDNTSLLPELAPTPDL